jgi:hypothetical protein
MTVTRKPTSVIAGSEHRERDPQSRRQRYLRRATRANVPHATGFRVKPGMTTRTATTAVTAGSDRRERDPQSRSQRYLRRATRADVPHATGSRVKPGMTVTLPPVIARSVSDEAIQFTAISLDCFGTKVPRNDDDTSERPSRDGIPARGRNDREK